MAADLPAGRQADADEHRCEFGVRGEPCEGAEVRGVGFSRRWTQIDADRRRLGVVAADLRVWPVEAGLKPCSYRWGARCGYR